MATGVTSVINPAHDYGTDEWVAKNLIYTRNTLRSAEGDVMLVVANVKLFARYCERHHISWTEWCRENLLAEPGWITKLQEGVAILKARGHEGPITREQAVAAAAETAKPAPKAGGKRNGAGRKGTSTVPLGTGNNQRDNDNGDSPRGTDPDYLTARIARDAPEVLEEMKAGKFKSVRAAAKAAGIVKDPDPVKIAARAVAAVPSYRLAELVCSLSVDVRRLLLACIKDAGVQP